MSSSDESEQSSSEDQHVLLLTNWCGKITSQKIHLFLKDENEAAKKQGRKAGAKAKAVEMKVRNRRIALISWLNVEISKYTDSLVNYSAVA